jgi:hypothetical protein
MTEIQRPGKDKTVEKLVVTPEMVAANRRFLKEWKKVLAAAKEKQKWWIGESIGIGGFKPIFYGDHDSEND